MAVSEFYILKKMIGLNGIKFKGLSHVKKSKFFHLVYR